MRFLLPAAAALLVACGSAGPARRDSAGTAGRSHKTARPAQATVVVPAPGPVTIQVKATRVGSSVRLDITGIGKRRPEGHAMENPRNWSILALHNDMILARKVNGSVRVARHPVGRADSGVWDITVMFNVAFAVPEAAKAVTIRIRAPEAEPFETSVPITSK